MIGTAVGLSAEQIRPFLVSLRTSGYAGELVLFVDRALERRLRADPEAQGVTLRRAAQWPPFRLGLLNRPRAMRMGWMPLQAALWRALRAVRALPLSERRRRPLELALAKLLYTPMETRFLRYEQYLRWQAHRRVMLTDVRDVVFQSDPFAALPARGLSVSIETGLYTLATESHNAAWLRRVYGEPMLERIGSRRVSCVGVTAGDAASIERYLRLFNSELLELSPQEAGIGGADTAIHNVLIWTGRLAEVHELEPLSSPVATLNGIPENEVSVSPEGRLLNRDGSLPSVLHQYDRLPGVRSQLLRALAG